MLKQAFFLFCCLGFVFAQAEKPLVSASDSPVVKETAEQKNHRMQWWRDARFGMFIHWGIYAVPAGKWNEKTNYGEWIRNQAHIPLEEYAPLAEQFNPTDFDPAEWVRIAKDAGMKYIVITSKHHDGFCLWDSKLTDFDIMDATPFKRDILKDLSEQCRKQGIRFGLYYSIMDWHHPDYLPRRDWEKRPAENADFTRYIAYMKGQLKELVENYNPEVLWFDGEWEKTWTEELGRDLYSYVRSLKPDIIINNRVGKGRKGMTGAYDPSEAVGDFGTPEQEIPATGLPYDWETCMTTNNHWGYNQYDKNFKSAQDIIRKLIDIASKGGNFLLNVGPTPQGTFPPQAVELLAQIGGWMQTNGDSICGTTASRFGNLPWGRSTAKDNRIYIHIFDWPSDRRLPLPGLVSKPISAKLLKDPACPVEITKEPDGVVLSLPEKDIDPAATVVKLEFESKPEIN